MAGSHGAADTGLARMHAIAALAGQVRREAYVSAYADAFWIVAVGLMLSLAAIFLLKKPQQSNAPVKAH
jgi:DHA2 family multidrug resistance protein